MTRDRTDRVTLSVRDWIVMVSIAFSLFSACAAGYLRIDRSLSELSIGQSHQAQITDGLNQDIQRLEARLMGIK